MSKVIRLAVSSTDVEDICSEAIGFFDDAVYDAGIMIDQIVCEYISMQVTLQNTATYSRVNYDDTVNEDIAKRLSNHLDWNEDEITIRQHIVDGLRVMDVEDVCHDAIRRFTRNVLKLYKRSKRQVRLKHFELRPHSNMTYYAVFRYEVM